MNFWVYIVINYVEWGGLINEKLQMYFFCTCFSMILFLGTESALSMTLQPMTAITPVIPITPVVTINPVTPPIVVNPPIVVKPLDPGLIDQNSKILTFNIQQQMDSYYNKSM